MEFLRKIGRGEWIRTTDPSVPNRVLYQAEPRPDKATGVRGKSRRPGTAVPDLLFYPNPASQLLQIVSGDNPPGEVLARRTDPRLIGNRRAARRHEVRQHEQFHASLGGHAAGVLR